MRLLPHFQVSETTLCDREGESEGWDFELTWLGLTVVLTIARRTRSVD